MSARRLGRLRAALDAAVADAVVVHRSVNIRYLSGFAGVIDQGFAGFLVVDSQQAVLVTDFRYEQQLQEKAQGTEIDIRSTAGDRIETLIDVLRDVGSSKVAVEDSMSVRRRAQIEKAFGAELAAVSDLVEAGRATKEPDEIEVIATAAKLCDEALAAVLPSIKVGVSTRKIALELEWYMRTHGARAAAFDLIVAAGARSSMPHATTTDEPIARGDFVKIDIGSVVDDYCSDMTRTVVVGEATREQQRIHAAVLQAQTLALEEVVVGADAKEVDAVARRYLEGAGFGPNFGHNLGHGVGLEIHERPTLGPLSKDVLAEAMVVTVEPGVYVPGVGGVRIEDLVVVEEAGPRVLTRSPRELTIV